MTLEELGLEIASVFAGLAGGLVSLTQSEKISAGRATILIISGGFSAGYLTPFLADHMRLGENLQNSLAFILGLISLKLIDFIFKKVDKYFKKKLQD